MLHTLEFYTNISQHEKVQIEGYYKKNIKQIVDQLSCEFGNLELRIGRQLWNKSHNVYLRFDIVKLLDRQEDGLITEADYPEIQSYIEALESKLFIGLEKQFILNRIDYRVDFKVSDIEQRKCLFHLWRKMAHSYGHLKKRTKKVNSKIRVVDGKETYVSEKTFKTTLYLASKSLVVCVYDKEAERLAKGITSKDYEQDVIRFEVRLMAKHLAYKARENKRERSLEAYMQKSCFNEYIQKYIINIFGTQDFHKINVVREKLRPTEISAKEQLKIVEFLKLISRSGVEAAIAYRTSKRKKKSGYSRYLMKKYQSILSSIGVHIILLPIRAKVKEDILNNPLKRLVVEEQ